MVEVALILAAFAAVAILYLAVTAQRRRPSRLVGALLVLSLIVAAAALIAAFLVVIAPRIGVGVGD